MHSTLCVVSRCVFCTIPVVPGAVWNPSFPPGDLAGTVHQSGRCQRLEDYLPIIWRYTYLIMSLLCSVVAYCYMYPVFCFELHLRLIVIIEKF